MFVEVIVVLVGGCCLVSSQAQGKLPLVLLNEKKMRLLPVDTESPVHIYTHYPP